MDIGNVVRRFRAIPVFDPFRRVPEVAPEPERETVALTLDGKDLGTVEAEVRR